MWRSEDNLKELVCFFYHMDFVIWTEKFFYLLSHLASLFLDCCFDVLFLSGFWFLKAIRDEIGFVFLEKFHMLIFTLKFCFFHSSISSNSCAAFFGDSCRVKIQSCSFSGSCTSSFLPWVPFSSLLNAIIRTYKCFVT